MHFYLMASEQNGWVGTADERGRVLIEAMALIRRRIMGRATPPMRIGETLPVPAERLQLVSLWEAVDRGGKAIKDSRPF